MAAATSAVPSRVVATDVVDTRLGEADGGGPHCGEGVSTACPQYLQKAQFSPNPAPQEVQYFIGSLPGPSSLSLHLCASL
jgi:hypothetical protein